MKNSTCEFHFHFNTPDEDTIHRINAVLAAQQYTKLIISSAQPTAVDTAYYRPDGTVNYKQRSIGISDIAFSGEIEEHGSVYNYRMQMDFLPRPVDRGEDQYRERWNKLHIYSTMRQLFRYEFNDGFVYLILYHEKRAEEETPETVSDSIKEVT